MPKANLLVSAPTTGFHLEINSIEEFAAFIHIIQALELSGAGIKASIESLQAARVQLHDAIVAAG